ncbi:MAG: OmpA family protein [Bacteroidota bacterium]
MTKINRNWFIATGFVVILGLVFGCNASKTMKGGAIGSGVGGAIGGAIGSKSDNTAKGAILGAVIGGTAGALIGNYMDKQAEELEADLENAEIERVGEGIRITFDSGILFDFDSYQLRPNARENLREMSETLNKYDETEILIEGHTDDIGSAKYNQNLSIQRANQVAEYLNELGIRKSRLISRGYGESQPVATNKTDHGRQQNRRVEVAIYANEELKDAAKDGDI